MEKTLRITDFHTHAFADAIAERAISKLVDRAVEITEGDDFFDFVGHAYSDGTEKGHIELMRKAGVTRSVLLPVATKSGQAVGINRWAKEFESRYPNEIRTFGAIFPDENSMKELEELAGAGYIGIKLHGDYQNFYADEPRMIEIYRKCAELGLYVVMHSGIDYLSPYDVHVTPERMCNVLDKVSGCRFILAHMGGNFMEKRAAELLSGADDVMVDTAYSANRLSPEFMTELIYSFGVDKVLFASDNPWNAPLDVYKLIESCGITDEEKQMIYHGNADRILGCE